jgi:hypothetical protein
MLPNRVGQDVTAKRDAVASECNDRPASVREGHSNRSSAQSNADFVLSCSVHPPRSLDSIVQYKHSVYCRQTNWPHHPDSSAALSAWACNVGACSVGMRTRVSGRATPSFSEGLGSFAASRQPFYETYEEKEERHTRRHVDGPKHVMPVAQHHGNG